MVLQPLVTSVKSVYIITDCGFLESQVSCYKCISFIAVVFCVFPVKIFPLPLVCSSKQNPSTEQYAFLMLDYFTLILLHIQAHMYILSFPPEIVAHYIPYP